MTARGITRPSKLSWSWQERLFQIGIVVVLVVVGLIFLFPYYYMFISSLREPFYNFDTIHLDLWPTDIHLGGYQRILETPLGGSDAKLGAVGALANGLKNTMIQELGIIIGGSITSLLAAYAFAKHDFPGKSFFFYLLLSAMIIPGEVTLVPKYVMFTRWGFIGTHWALIIPAVLGAGGWFLMRMFMSTIPNAYIDSARIDGANEFRIVWSIIAPLAKPVIIVHVLFTFLGVWNDLMGPLMYVNVREKYTLQMVLYVIQASYNFVYGYGYGDTTGLRMQTLFAGLVLGSLPTIIIFIVFQRYITQGTVITGLKI